MLQHRRKRALLALMLANFVCPVLVHHFLRCTPVSAATATVLFLVLIFYAVDWATVFRSMTPKGLVVALAALIVVSTVATSIYLIPQRKVVAGRVVESRESRKPLPGLQVSCIEAGSEPIGEGTLTDDLGNFSVRRRFLRANFVLLMTDSHATKGPIHLGLTEYIAKADGNAEPIKELAFPSRTADAYVFDCIYFDNGKTVIKVEFYSLLQQIVAYLQSHPDMDLVLRGHCSTLGDDRRNMALSRERVMTAMQILANEGVTEERLIGVGCGERITVSAGSDKKSHSLNRRLELVAIPMSRSHRTLLALQEMPELHSLQTGVVALVM